MEARTITRRAAPLVLVAALSAAPAACGGSPEPESPFQAAGPQEALIIVDNSNTAISEMTVYLIPAAGVRQRLGTVTLEERKTFTVTEANWGSEFQLLGDPAGTSELFSRGFDLIKGNVVEWNVDLNRVSLRGSRGGG